MATVEAIYQDGVFKPLAPVSVNENQRVTLEINPVAGAEMSNWLEDARRLRQQFEEEYGQLPDSTPDIAEDRQRDA